MLVTFTFFFLIKKLSDIELISLKIIHDQKDI